jgi:ABC-type branched-subunit amino acid transport system substrate-binding protein
MTLTTAAAGDETIKIGHVDPLTGAIVHVGKDNDNGARLVVASRRRCRPCRRWVQGYRGVIGEVTFDSRGDLKHDAISLYEYRGHKKSSRCREDVVQIT